jgi:hypothetical protein
MPSRGLNINHEYYYVINVIIYEKNNVILLFSTFLHLWQTLLLHYSNHFFLYILNFDSNNSYHDFIETRMCYNMIIYILYFLHTELTNVMFINIHHNNRFYLCIQSYVIQIFCKVNFILKINFIYIIFFSIVSRYTCNNFCFTLYIEREILYYK